MQGSAHCGATELVSQFERWTVIEDHGHGVEMSLARGPHQTRHIPGATPIHVRPLCQQVFGDIRPAEPAGKLERRPEFGLRCATVFDEFPL